MKEKLKLKKILNNNSNLIYYIEFMYFDISLNLIYAKKSLLDYFWLFHFLDFML